VLHKCSRYINTNIHTSVHRYIYACIHYMTSHCINLHDIASHCITCMHGKDGEQGMETCLISLASASFHMMPCHFICFILDATPLRMVSLHFYQFGLTSFHIFVLWLWPWLWPWLWLLLWLWPECWAHFI
jgi:hypothetical protein